MASPPAHTGAAAAGWGSREGWRRLQKALGITSMLLQDLALWEQPLGSLRPHREVADANRQTLSQ